MAGGKRLGSMAIVANEKLPSAEVYQRLAKLFSKRTRTFSGPTSAAVARDEEHSQNGRWESALGRLHSSDQRTSAFIPKVISLAKAGERNIFAKDDSHTVRSVVPFLSQNDVGELSTLAELRPMSVLGAATFELSLTGRFD